MAGAFLSRRQPNTHGQRTSPAAARSARSRSMSAASFTGLWAPSSTASAPSGVRTRSNRPGRVTPPITRATEASSDRRPWRASSRPTAACTRAVSSTRWATAPGSGTGGRTRWHRHPTAAATAASVSSMAGTPWWSTTASPPGVRMPAFWSAMASSDVAQHRLVVEVDPRDDGQLVGPGDRVGAVVAAPQAGLEHHQVAALAHEVRPAPWPGSPRSRWADRGRSRPGAWRRAAPRPAGRPPRPASTSVASTENRSRRS